MAARAAKVARAVEARAVVARGSAREVGVREMVRARTVAAVEAVLATDLVAREVAGRVREASVMVEATAKAVTAAAAAVERVVVVMAAAEAAAAVAGEEADVLEETMAAMVKVEVI